jgi:hypothetical protein
VNNEIRRQSVVDAAFADVLFATILFAVVALLRGRGWRTRSPLRPQLLQPAMWKLEKLGRKSQSPMTLSCMRIAKHSLVRSYHIEAVAGLCPAWNMLRSWPGKMTNAAVCNTSACVDALWAETCSLRVSARPRFSSIPPLWWREAKNYPQGGYVCRANPASKAFRRP